jgi:hypothetical protein
LKELRILLFQRALYNYHAVMYFKKEIIISFLIITISASNLYMPMIWLYLFLLDCLIPFLCDPDLQCRANDIRPSGSYDLLGQWRGVAGAQHRNPFRAPPPLLPSAGKTGSSSGEKGLSFSEGLCKEYMTWCKTSVGKPGSQAEGRHVVIRASQG